MWGSIQYKTHKSKRSFEEWNRQKIWGEGTRKRKTASRFNLTYEYGSWAWETNWIIRAIRKNAKEIWLAAKRTWGGTQALN